MNTELLTHYADLKNLSFETDEISEILKEIQDGNRDFEAANWRFIDKDDIDETQQEELKGDLYMLGCFRAEFVANILGLPSEAIEAMQKAEAFEAIGMLLEKHIEELQEAYASADGYGHHFAHYDHEEHDIFDGNYYAFKVN